MDSLDLHGPLLAGLENCLDSGEYSDFRITTGGSCVYKLHKIVLSSQSSVFAAACNGIYPPQFPLDPETGAMEISSEFHDPKAVFSMVYFLYHFSYSDDYPPRIVHVYNIAQAFDISALEALAIQRFEEAAIDQWDTDGFADAIEELYDTEPNQENGLRNAILRISASHLDALLQQRGSFYRFLKSSGQFGADMVEYLMKSRQPAVRTEFKVECGNCHRAYSSSGVAWEKCHCANPSWSLT